MNSVWGEGSEGEGGEGWRDEGGRDKVNSVCGGEGSEGGERQGEQCEGVGRERGSYYMYIIQLSPLVVHMYTHARSMS